MLRGSRDFNNITDYELFLVKVVQTRNHGRISKLTEEYKLMKALPENYWNAPKIIPARVSPSSTVSILKGIYSVPSRLISLLLHAHVYAKEIVLYYGDKEIQRMPRLPKEGGASINYRHIISHLLRKPGAFRNYQYHDSLFPRTIFRIAYDFLINEDKIKGSKKYLEILNYAAITNEQEVAVALELLIAEQVSPVLEAVKTSINQSKKQLPIMEMYQANLNQYDQLIGWEKKNVCVH